MHSGTFMNRGTTGLTGSVGPVGHPGVAGSPGRPTKAVKISLGLGKLTLKHRDGDNADVPEEYAIECVCPISNSNSLNDSEVHAGPFYVVAFISVPYDGEQCDLRTVGSRPFDMDGVSVDEFWRFAKLCMETIDRAYGVC